VVFVENHHCLIEFFNDGVTSDVFRSRESGKQWIPSHRVQYQGSSHEKAEEGNIA
jgi:hypothetical protein